MSTYFNLYCKHKETNEKPILLLWLSTTPARELASEVGLRYSYETAEEIETKKSSYVSLTKDMLKDIIYYYKDTKENLEKNIFDDQKEANKILDLLPLANSNESYNRMIEHRNSLLSNINEAKEELSFIKTQYHNFSFIFQIIDEEINSDLELFYSLA